MKHTLRERQIKQALKNFDKFWSEENPYNLMSLRAFRYRIYVMLKSKGFNITYEINRQLTNLYETNPSGVPKCIKFVSNIDTSDDFLEFTDILKKKYN